MSALPQKSVGGISLTGVGGGLNVSSVVVVGADPGEFSIDGFSGPDPPFTLPPGGSNQVDVSFNPGTPGAKSAILRVFSNDPDGFLLKGGANNPVDVPLQGQGVIGGGTGSEQIPTLSGIGLLLMLLGLLLAGILFLLRPNKT